MKNIIPIFTGNIVKGKLKIAGAVREQMAVWLKSFETGTQVSITIKKYVRSRTGAQNAYYFGVVIPILCDYFGYETEEMHEEMKLKFNPVESKLQPGKIIGGSTSKMKTEEFFVGETSFVNRVRRWAAIEYQINIPDPKEVE